MESIDQAPERRTLRERRSPGPTPIERDLAAALDRGGIEILFQPQFACADGRVVGAEALARWQHPVHGLLGADLLFGIAARAGLVAALSHHVARAALAQAARWPAPLRLSLNVAAADLTAADFAQATMRAIAEAGFAPQRLTLELTEQVLVADLDRAAGRLRPLADLGVRLALDDFGAGFCNFEYLKRLPLSGLKLDRSMVEGIAENPRDLAVLRAIMAMAHALDLDVTAEGIEREDQRAVIAREGCAAWQGYLGARPIPGSEFAALIER